MKPTVYTKRYVDYNEAATYISAKYGVESDPILNSIDHKQAHNGMFIRIDKNHGRRDEVFELWLQEFGDGPDRTVEIQVEW